MVGIVGAGQMGSGIAQVVACRGLTAILHDASKAALSRGSASVERSLERLVGKPGGLSADDAAAALGRIHTTHDLEASGG